MPFRVIGMLKIRMQRTGRINMPSYRIVVTEHTASPQAGKYVERVGSYDPKSNQRTLVEDRIKYWMSVGAKPSDTVHNMLVSAGILNAKKINVLPSYKEPVPAASVEDSGVPKKEPVVEMPPDLPAEALAQAGAALAVEAAEATTPTSPPESVGKEKTTEEVADAPKEA